MWQSREEETGHVVLPGSVLLKARADPVVDSADDNSRGKYGLAIGRRVYFTDGSSAFDTEVSPEMRPEGSVKSRNRTRTCARSGARDAAETGEKVYESHPLSRVNRIPGWS